MKRPKLVGVFRIDYTKKYKELSSELKSALATFNGNVLRILKSEVNDVEAFLDGDTKGQLDLPRAQKGGMVGGLHAIFVPSESATGRRADGQGSL